MSADEDTELRDLVALTLESNGVLGKIRAQLRASVFLALEEQNNVQNSTPFFNPDLKKFLATKEGQTVVELVREFLDFFNLDFTQAVFEPESGCGATFGGRAGLAKELNLHDNVGGPKLPLLAEILKRSQAEKTGGGNRQLNEELTVKQLADAKKKFDYYDQDKNNEIDKDELRGLFVDLFPNFNRNMLDRYVTDEFKAADRDISNSISFQEFIAMYKRLFLQCRSVVSRDVSDISPSSPSKGFSSHTSKASNSDRSEQSLVDSQHSHKSMENGPNKQYTQDKDNTDTEEDFFDDPISFQGMGHKSYGSKSNSQKNKRSGRPSQIPVFSALRSEEKQKDKPISNGIGHKSVSQAARFTTEGGMSSRQGMPVLPGERNTGKKSQHGETGDNLRSMDKRMAELELDGDAQDYMYEDDFQSEGHSLSQKSPKSRSDAKSEANGSMAEEIEEDIDEHSIDGDDFFHSEKSAFDEVTTDRTISQQESGYDYMEDLQLH